MYGRGKSWAHGTRSLDRRSALRAGILCPHAEPVRFALAGTTADCHMLGTCFHPLPSGFGFQESMKGQVGGCRALRLPTGRAPLPTHSPLKRRVHTPVHGMGEETEAQRDARRPSTHSPAELPHPGRKV